MHYQQQNPPDSSDTARAWQARNLAGLATLGQQFTALTPAQSASPATWTRAQLLVAAIANSPTLRVSRAQLQTVLAARQSAAQRPNPTLSLGADYNLSQVSESPWLWSLSLDLLPDPAHRRQLRLALADVDVLEIRSRYAEALWTLRSNLRNAELRLVLNTERGRLLQQQLLWQQELVDLAVERVNSGFSAATSLPPLQQELSRLFTEINVIDFQKEQARSELATLLGLPVAALHDLEIDWNAGEFAPEPGTGEIVRMRELALLSRPDLEQAVLDYQRRDLELQQQLALQYPAVSLAPGYSWDHGVQRLTGGVSFSLPLLNRNEAPIAEALARRNESGEQVLSRQIGILQEIDSALLAYHQTGQASDAFRGQVDSALELLSRTTRQLALGATDRQALLVAQLNAGQQQLALLDQTERLQLGVGQLEDALRQPLEGPELQLPQTLFRDVQEAEGEQP